MINIWQHHVWTDMHKRLAYVHSILGRGSLIPLPPFEVRETDQIKLQVMGFVVTLKTLRATVILTNWIWWNAAITTATFPYFR